MAQFRLALTGDSIITRRTTVHADAPTQALYDSIRSADVAFTNLEVIPNDFRGYPAVESGGSHFAAHAWVVDELVAMGFDLFACAHNHALDYSIEGLLATLETLDRKGVTYAGIGRTLAEARMPAYFDHGAGSVALISCCSSFAKGQTAGEQRPDMQGRPGINPLRYTTTYGVTAAQLDAIRAIADELGIERQRQETLAMGFGFPPDDPAVFPFLDANYRAAERPAITTEPKASDLDAIALWVREARARADLVVVSLHAHEQGTHREEPAAFIPTFAHRMIDEGADVVVGHGPHLLRGMELYRGKPIFYSLGNLIGQNELVWRLPADSYERFRVDPAKTPSEVYRIRYDDDRKGFPADARFWQTVVPICRFEGGALAAIEIVPAALGHGLPPHRRGRPWLAEGAAAEEILNRFVQLSAVYGTRTTMMTDERGAMMSERAERLATELEQANGEMIAFTASCPADSWTAPCVDDGRTVAAVVRHVGGAYIAHMRLVQAVAAGEPIPAMFGDWAVIHQGNAISAEKYAQADRGETIASLQRNGANLAAAIRALTDAQLDRTAVVPIFDNGSRTTEQIIEIPVIAHPHGHLVGLRATVDTKEQ